MRLHWNEASSPGFDTAVLEQAIAALGVRAGHRIALLAGNTPLAIHMQHAARRRGWTLVPMSPQDPRLALEAQAREAACDAWVCTKKQRALATSLRGRKPLLSCDAWGAPDRADAGPLQAREATQPPPAFILQTSGTSGVPHAVEITWSMLDAHAAAATRRISDSSDAVWAGVLGLHRIGGVALAQRVLRNNGTLLLEERFDAERLARLLRHRGVTHVSLVPTMLHRLFAGWGEAPPPRALQCILLGGDAAPDGLVQPALARGWPIWCSYGLTEATSQVATSRPAERRAKPGTSGRPLDGVRIEVRDEEIFLSGPTIAGGGPLATGDLGRLDADGFLFVTGRKDDRITTGGAKVDPDTVEEVLRAHPDVEDACVVGAADNEWGQRVVAALVIRQEIPLAGLRAWCAERLAAPAVPKEFRVVPELPRTEQGKLRRAEVRASLQATMPT